MEIQEKFLVIADIQSGSGVTYLRFRVPQCLPIPEGFATKAIHSSTTPDNWDSMCVVPPIVIPQHLKSTPLCSSRNTNIVDREIFRRHPCGLWKTPSVQLPSFQV
ncbi:hypothetical protein Trydic_g11828 [Trypoxylus dichotomus]